MSTEINFTKAAIDGLVCEAGRGRVRYYDTKVPNLTVNVHATGKKVFYRYGRINGRVESVKLGVYPGMTPEQARQKAQRENGDIAQGKNPAAERRAKRVEGTLDEVFKDFVEKHGKVYKRERSWRDDEKQWDRYMGPWKGRKFSAVTRETVEEVHRKVGRDHGHYAANRLLALLSAVFNHARREPNPAKGVRRFPEQSRERFLHPDEFPRFWRALESEQSDLLRDFFKVALLTGARRSNVQAMRWDHVSLERGTWTIPAEEAKGNQSLVVHLATPVVEVLRARKAANDARPVQRRSEWVFPSYGKTGHLTEPKAAWAAILKRAELKDLRIHDLRRTLGSWQAMTGASLPVIGKSLGHRNQSTTAIYSRMNLDPVKAAVNTATTAMLAAAKAPTAKQIEATEVAADGADDGDDKADLR